MSSAEAYVSSKSIVARHLQSLNGAQITYIGVPLAVAGGLPLMYGFLKSMWIWYKLSRSVPWELRKFYTLIPDPVAGTVLVSAKRLQLKPKSGIWRPRRQPRKALIWHKRIHVFLWYIHVSVKVISGRPKGNIRPPKSEDHISLLERGITLLDHEDASRIDETDFNGPCAAISSDISGPDSSHCGYIFPADGLYSPWMSTGLAFGLDLEEMKPDCEDHKPVRGTVNLDWQIVAPPLTMTWAQFVWLMLGMEVLPGALMEMRTGDRLWTANAFNVQISRLGNKWVVRPDRAYSKCSNSIRNALAVGGIMLVADWPTLELRSKQRRFSERSRLRSRPLTLTGRREFNDFDDFEESVVRLLRCTNT